MTPPADRRETASGLPLPWWSLAYAILTTAGLALLAWGLVVVQALGYTASRVMDLGPVPAPDADRYALALAVAVAVNLGGSLALSRAWSRRREPALAPAMAAVPVALAGGTVAAVAMLAVLRIAPTDVVDLL